MVLSNKFAAEEFLSHSPPNYSQEWNRIILNFILSTIVFLLIVPIVANVAFVKKRIIEIDEGGESSKSSIESSSANKKTKADKKTGPKKRNKKPEKNTHGPGPALPPIATTKIIIQDSNTKNPTTSTSSTHVSQGNDSTANIPWFFFPVVNVIYLVSLFTILAHSPDNSYAARRVYVAPLLREDECTQIIQLAESAARRNAKTGQQRLLQLQLERSENGSTTDEKKELEKLLKEPSGWKKDRHQSYPTTDLNVVLDFEREDKVFLKRLLDARLTPMLEMMYGIPRDSIRANDMFVVRYDGDGQQSLNKHTDSSHISFNVLLNDAFTGGGTRFHDRFQKTVTDVKAKPGEVLINNAMVAHEGLATTSGTRYIFVGFMNVDRKDPMTGRPSGLSWFSSWLSFPWLTVTIKEGLEVKVANKRDQVYVDGGGGVDTSSSSSLRGLSTGFSNDYYIDGFLDQAIQLFAKIGDRFAPHEITTLVKKEQYDNYINALEIDYEKNRASIGQANWFAGQQINVGLDGLMGNEWQNRFENKEAFSIDL